MAICNVSSYHEGSSCHGVLVSKPKPVSFRVEKGSSWQYFFLWSKLKIFFVAKIWITTTGAAIDQRAFWFMCCCSWREYLYHRWLFLNAMIRILDLQQFYYCNLKALSFAPFVFATTFGMSPSQSLTKFWWYAYISFCALRPFEWCLCEESNDKHLSA